MNQRLDQNVHQAKIVKVLGTAQVLSGIGTTGTVAAGSLLVSSISHSTSLAGLAQTTAVLGAAAMALPLARLTQLGGRRLALSSGYFVGVLGALLAIVGGSHRTLFVVLIGTFMVGAASASGYQARFAAIDLATDASRSKNLSFVVWGSTIGAVTGPNLMQPSGNLAQYLGLPRLAGPYLIAALTLLLAALVTRLLLVPDPYLTANRNADGTAPRKLESTLTVLRHIRSYPNALFAIATVAIGHLAMVSVMVMTPVHMAMVDVTLTVIGLVISVHVLGMYAFSPLVGALSDRIGRIRVIQLGVVLLLLAALVAGTAPGMDSVRLGVGLFLLGLGWSCTLIAGSTFLSESVDVSMRPSSQGASDLVMNLMGAGGGAVAGVIISTLSYAWLCLAVSIPVAILGVWSLRMKNSSAKRSGPKATETD
ncbi:MAG TPA: MFS transporter [Acidimicrobiales bacterium]|nr:MFS transporter [Acidimicrobiales bacterium]